MISTILSYMRQHLSHLRKQVPIYQSTLKRLWYMGSRLRGNDNIRHVAILCFFVSICFFFGLGYYAIANINEGLYAEIPREMLINNNYIIPTLNFVPYIEKPPLLYWLIAITYKLFGISEFTARFIPASSAAAISLMTYFFCRKTINKEAGFIAGLILATNALFVLMGRIVLFDMLLTACFTASIYTFYLWYKSDDKFYLRVAYLFLALAVLAKGFLALFLAPIITFVFMLTQETPTKKIIQFFDPIGIVLFLLVASPWHIIASLQNSEFAWQYFINEHVMRFLDKRIPNDYHHGPFYFYLPRLFIYLLPWTLLVPLLLKKTPQSRLKALCWTWFLTVLIFFSISKAKGDYYMIIGMPPLVILLADKITHATYKNNYLTRVYIALTFLMTAFSSLLLLGILSPSVAHYLPKKLQLETFLKMPLTLLVSFLSFYFLVSLAFYKKLIENKSLQIILYAALMVPLVLFYLADKKHFEFRQSEKLNASMITSPLVGEVGPVIRDGRGGLYIYKHFEDLSSIVFYTQQRVKIINSKSRDLYFGSTQPEAKGWFVDFNEVKDVLKSGPVYILAKKGNYPALKKELGSYKMNILSDNGNDYLVAVSLL